MESAHVTAGFVSGWRTPLFTPQFLNRCRKVEQQDAKKMMPFFSFLLQMRGRFGSEGFKKEKKETKIHRRSKSLMVKPVGGRKTQEFHREEQLYF